MRGLGEYIGPYHHPALVAVQDIDLLPVAASQMRAVSSRQAVPTRVSSGEKTAIGGRKSNQNLTFGWC
jgi:hypothetical protein